MSKLPNQFNRQRTAKGGYYQGMKSRDYWKLRSKEKLSESFATAQEVEEYSQALYKKCLIDFCGKYNELVKPFVKNGELDLGALARARLTDSSFAYKFARLQTEIDLFTSALGEEQVKKIGEMLEQVYKDNVIKTFADFHKSADGMEILNQSAISRAVRTPFTADGREFSDRIWDNLNLMNGKLRATLAESIAKGESIQKTTRKFKDIFGNTTYNTERIIRTETMAAYSKASTNSYKELGVEELEVLAERDACPVCQNMARKKIKVREAETGVNIPPAHPFCKCCVAPVVKWSFE